jgi:hypothetical protein
MEVFQNSMKRSNNPNSILQSKIRAKIENEDRLE